MTKFLCNVEEYTFFKRIRIAGDLKMNINYPALNGKRVFFIHIFRFALCLSKVDSFLTFGILSPQLIIDASVFIIIFLPASL